MANPTLLLFQLVLVLFVPDPQSSLLLPATRFQTSAIAKSTPHHGPRSSPGRSAVRPGVRQSFGIIHNFVSSQPTVDLLPKQVRKGEARSVCPRIGQVLFDKFTETQPFVQLPHQNQAVIGSNPLSLKRNPQKPVAGRLKCLFPAPAHSVCTSGTQC
jgi:hypothetical protein